MSRFLKTLHLTALSFGFLAAVAVIFNLVVFSILYPQVTQLLAEKPNWETYGVLAAINIIVIAFFQLFCVIALLSHLIKHKKTSTLVTAAIASGVISGIMILGDISLLSDIGNEYQAGFQTRGEWLILFASYALHLASLVLGLLALIRNLNQVPRDQEQVLKDEVLFLSLISTGIISGWLGLVGVMGALAADIPLWMMQRIAPMLSIIILSPFLVLLVIWLLRGILSSVKPSLDEKQLQDLSTSSLWTLIITLPVMIVFFGFQLSSLSRESWEALWLPLLLFLSITSFSSFTMRYFREYRSG
jgi:hypothetical protein